VGSNYIESETVTWDEEKAAKLRTQEKCRARSAAKKKPFSYFRIKEKCCKIIKVDVLLVFYFMVPLQLVLAFNNTAEVAKRLFNDSCVCFFFFFFFLTRNKEEKHTSSY
jgi:hypothetical protein